VFEFNPSSTQQLQQLFFAPFERVAQEVISNLINRKMQINKTMK
jgi:hypothetical protein